MKNKNFRLASIGLAVATLILVAACSDGVSPKTPEPSPSPSCNATLQAYKIGQDVSSAVTGEIAITEGEGIVLIWTAGPVTKASITSDPEAFLGAPMELALAEKPAEEAAPAKAESKGGGVKEAVGQKEFANITHNVSLELVGTNEVKGNAPTECKGHMNVAVTPASDELKINKFVATPEIITAGGVSRLEWDVVPADAAVTIVDDEGNSLAPVVVAEPEPATTEETSGEIVAKGFAKAVAEEDPEAVPECLTGEEEGCVPPPPVNAFSASGYIDVTPLKTTTYTLTATTADGQSISANATVSIEEEGLSISFTANGVEGVYTLEKPDEVRLSWAVTPPEAVVTIDQGIGDVKSEDVLTVNVSATTTYTLTATLGDKVESKQVTVNLGQAVISNLVATLKSNTTSVFAGESVAISWSVADEAGAPLTVDNAKVTLTGPEGSFDIPGTGTTATIKPVLSGLYSVEIFTDKGPAKSNSIPISVRTWDARESAGSWTAVGASGSSQVVLFGKSGGGSSNIMVAKATGEKGFKESKVDFKALFTSQYVIKNKTDDILGAYGPYAINAFAFDKNKDGGKRVYGATTGGIIYSSDEGESWDVVDVAILFQGDVQRNSCKGSTQVGDTTGKNTFKNLVKVCDLLVDNSSGVDRLVAATDNGVFYVDDVDAHMADRKDTKYCWQGIPDNKCSTPNELSGSVVNAVESFGGTLYAATAKGVWASGDRGESWSEYNGGEISNGQAIYALAIDASNKEIYAGGPDGVFYTKLGDVAAWTRLGEVEGSAYSITLDHNQSGTVFVGAETGIYVSRDFGETFINVSETMGSAGTVYDVLINSLSNSIGIYAASANGAFSSVAQVVPTLVVETPPPPVEEVPVVEPAAVNAVNALQSLVK